MDVERTRNAGLKGATATVYREVRERARLISEALRGLEPTHEPLDDLFPTSNEATDRLAPAYELAPRRATGT